MVVWIQTRQRGPTQRPDPSRTVHQDQNGGSSPPHEPEPCAAAPDDAHGYSCWPFPPEPAFVTFAVALRRLGPTSSTSSSYTVRFTPCPSSYERCFSRPWMMTRIPFVNDSATFSAACRHTEHVRNRLSPS